MNQVVLWFGMTSNMIANSAFNGIGASNFNSYRKTILVFESLNFE